MSTLTIGQVAERTGFTTSALRYYEELGLVAPLMRTEAGYRLYGDDAVNRLAFVARAKQLGCSLDEIADLLAIWDGDQCAPVQRRFHELVTAKIHETQDQIGELIAFASQLQAAAARLGTPSIDGPCGDGCACIATADEVASTSVLMAAARPGDPPITCTLEPGARPDRRADWQSVLSAACERSTTDDGRLRIGFGPDVDLAALTRLIQAEHQCCSFFAFALTVDERGIALEVGAPDAAAEIVDSMFGRAT